VHNKTKAKKKATYLESKWVQGLSEKLAEKKLVGEERREEAFCGRDTVRKRENASGKKKNAFYIFN